MVWSTTRAGAPLKRTEGSNVRREQLAGGNCVLRDHHARVGIVGQYAKTGGQGEVAVPTVLLGLRDRRVPVQPGIGAHTGQLRTGGGAHAGEPAPGELELRSAGGDQRGAFDRSG